MRQIDVLIPTYNRPAALAITLTSLALQRYQDFRVVISDQSETLDVASFQEVQTAINLLRSHGNEVEIYKHLPPRGMAEQRQFLLDQVVAPYALFLDDDLIMETYVISNMIAAVQEEKCGFVGCAVIGLSFMEDFRPHEQDIEFWEGPVQPEMIEVGSQEWERYQLHNAANLYHVEKKLGLSPDHPLRYKVAWVGGCVLYDRAKLEEVGGFTFWKDLPPKHCGEDVFAQLKVMARFGGCGLIPSGVYHLEIPTTVEDRQVNAPVALEIF
jgi:GT2 family glycosyltransferase